MWTHYFVKDHQTLDGRSIKILTVVDEYTRECLALVVTRSITTAEVVGVLRGLFAVRGVPAQIRSDNGPEFIAKQVRAWLEQNRVGHCTSSPGRTGRTLSGRASTGSCGTSA